MSSIYRHSEAKVDNVNPIKGPSSFFTYLIGSSLNGDIGMFIQLGYLLSGILGVLVSLLFYGFNGLILSSIIFGGVGYAYHEKVRQGVYLPSDWQYKKNVEDKVILVTGCNVGMGKGLIFNLVEWRAKHVLMACRNMNEAAKAKEEAEAMGKKLGSPTKLTLISVDLSDLASIKPAIAKIEEATTEVNMIVACAGIMMCPLMKTKQGYEMQFGTNHLGHYALIKGLEPMLSKCGSVASPSRVIAFSSVGHQFGCNMHYKGKSMMPEVLEDYAKNFDDKEYDRIDAYGVSKMSNVLMVKYMQDEEDSKNGKGSRTVCFYSVHPGGVKTKLARHIETAGVWKYMQHLIRVMSRDVSGGIQSCLMCMTAPSEFLNPGGYYFDCKEYAANQECQYLMMRDTLKRVSDEIVDKYIS